MSLTAHARRGNDRSVSHRAPSWQPGFDRALGIRRRWLDKALWHTREALTLCPLQGQGYLYLAELSFLDDVNRRLPAALIDQALAVRPHDGGVLFKAGEEAALAGDAEAAIGYWKRAFHAGSNVPAAD